MSDFEFALAKALIFAACVCLLVGLAISVPKLWSFAQEEARTAECSHPSSYTAERCER
jgi:hypothetical protein